MVRMAAGVAMVGVMMLAVTSGAAAQADDPESPAAPVNVRVVAEADGSVTVSWDMPGGGPQAESYRVYFRLAAVEGGAQPVQARWWSYKSAGDVGPDSRQGRVWGLTNGVWYELTVVAKYGDDDRVWSDDSVLARPGAVAPDVRPPDILSAAKVSAEGSGSVTVDWEPPADDGGSAVTGYEVWYIGRQDRWQDSSEKADEVVWTRSGGPLGADVRSHVVEGLVDFREYSVVVAAVNGVGRGLFSVDLYAVAGRDDLDPPGAPVNVRVVSLGDGSVTVAWDAPVEEEGRPSPTGYRVWYRTVVVTAGSQPSPSTWPRSDAFGSDSREGTVRGLTNDTWYEFRVQSIAGDWSDSAALGRPGETPVEVGLPAAPADLRVVAAGSGSVTLVWEPPADDGGSAVTGYEVWYVRRQDRRVGGGYVMSAVLPATATERVVTGLVDYQHYEVLVAAVNEAGRGLFTSVWATANRDDHDPLGLIAGHRFARAYSVGADIWEVWVCDVADGRLSVDVVPTVTLLNREITPYFAWLSEGKYRPEFVAGGTVRADPDVSSDSARDYGCDGRVEEVSEGGTDGAVVILDKEGLVSSGNPGSWAGSFVEHLWQVTTAGFPDNGRDLTLTARAVLPISAYCSNCHHLDHIDLDVVAHEMGHALGWPHSYGGNRPVKSEALLEAGYEVSQYDNPMDMVSGSRPERQLGQHGLVAGTIAVNRYAAGWIEPGDVAVHDGGIAAYQLAPVGTSGTQMLAIPTGASGHFISLGARVARGYDQGIPAEGVEVYRIDQRASVCRESPPNPDRLSCTGTGRRTQQVPPPPDDDREVEELTDHVYGAGEALTVEGYRVEVTERVGDRFHVWVGNPYRGAFADDENSTHEEAIETLVSLGITDGCNPGLKLFCPDHEITRAQLAKFLILAIRETPSKGSGPPVFSDVAADAWYRPYVDRLAELGITTGYGDGTYRPKEVVTRAQMAVFLTSAFTEIGAVETPVGVFDDVPASVSYAGAVEGILAAGITQGCKKTPGRNYCPDEPVKRSQMASFITRAIEAAG